MKIGIMGLGKVGLPIALSLAVHGKHQVAGYDPSPLSAEIFTLGASPYREEGLPELLAQDHGIVLEGSPGELVLASDLVIIAVPTPHGEGYGGEAPVTQPAKDFDYRYLSEAVATVCAEAEYMSKRITVSVLSTVLPGTIARISQLAGPHSTVVYSPAFISLGTTIPDFEYPPFVLCGVIREEDAEPVHEMYAELPASYGMFFDMSYETAETAKMIYNAWGALRITFANQVAELCDKAGADCDRVTDLLHFAPSGIRAGMPDGGPCRPRDLIALSWLAQEKGLSHDLFRDIARTREAHAKWLALLLREQARTWNLPAVILGKAYKPETDLADGSPSLLVAYFMRGFPVEIWEPGMPVIREPRVYLAAVKYVDVLNFPYAPGSVVIDPWGFIPDRQGVRVIRLGRN